MAILFEPASTTSLYANLDLPPLASPFRTFATDTALHQTPVLFRLQKRSPVDISGESKGAEESMMPTNLSFGSRAGQKSSRLARETRPITGESGMVKGRKMDHLQSAASAFEQEVPFKEETLKSKSYKGDPLRYTYTIPEASVLQKDYQDKVSKLDEALQEADHQKWADHAAKVDMAVARLAVVEKNDAKAAEKVGKYHHDKSKRLGDSVKNEKGYVDQTHPNFFSFHKNHMKATEFEERARVLAHEKLLQDHPELGFKPKAVHLRKRSPMFHHEDATSSGVDEEVKISPAIAKQWKEQLQKERAHQRDLPSHTYTIPPLDALHKSLRDKQMALNVAKANGESGQVVSKLEGRVDVARARVQAVQDKDPAAAGRVTQHHSNKAESLQTYVHNKGLLVDNHPHFKSYVKNVGKADQWNHFKEELLHHG
jgi:hypothetical protein